MESAWQHCGPIIPISLVLPLTVGALFFVYCAQDRDNIVPLLPMSFFKLPSLFLSEEKLVLFSQCQPHRLLFPALYMVVRWQEWERVCHRGRCEAGGHKISDLGTGWKKQGSRSPVWLARQRLSTLLFILQVLKYFPTVVFGNSGNFCCHLSWTQNSFPHFFFQFSLSFKDTER